MALNVALRITNQAGPQTTWDCKRSLYFTIDWDPLQAVPQNALYGKWAEWEKDSAAGCFPPRPFGFDGDQRSSSCHATCATALLASERVR